MNLNKSLVFIQKNGFDYSDGIINKIVHLVFQPNIIQDLEVVDKDQLQIQVKSFLDTNKIKPTNILFVIADSVIFEKTFTLTSAINKDFEIQRFLENIPFEHVSFKVIEGQKDFRVLAINKEMYTVLKSSFESLGFKTTGIIAQSMLGEIYKNRSALDSDMVKNILNHFDQFKKESFIHEEVVTVNESQDKKNLPIPQNGRYSFNKIKLPLIISFVVVTLGALSLYIYFQFPPKSKASPVPTTIVAPSLTASPVPTTEEIPLSTSSATPAITTSP